MAAEGMATAPTHQRTDGGTPFICDEDTWLTATAGTARHAAAADTTVLDAVAGHLLALQWPGGGWSYTESARLTDVDCTSAAVQVFHLTGPRRHRAAISRGIGARHALRGPDGGFPAYLAGAPSEASMSAAAVPELHARGRHRFRAPCEMKGILL
ncbi:hypothetical protein AMK16_27625 [Streptomyces sp. CB00455]|uniref:hypothetical protein n=1 Tax=Streptomyces sp. CB00455 TaxID=1703927 RepID=UPI00095E2E4A|nr:hypothetical protein [Streptomyces sp. CB00455]OKK15659.1 hypothetical protein AMK16_27625 [Streptomyces sp. CB00455]